MLNAIDVPFDASKYAFRTNFDGLTITNNSFSDRLENAKTKYQDALKQFESVDKDARKEYKDSKDEGFTSDNFGTWVVQNVSPCLIFTEYRKSVKIACLNLSTPLIVSPME